MRSKVAILAFCWFVYSFGYTFAVNDAAIDSNDVEFLHKKYVGMNKGLQEVVEKSIKSILPSFMEANEHINISSNCRKEALLVVSGIRKLQQWALSFPDASGKLIDGFLSGNTHMLGNYDQCLRSAALKKNGQVDFRGRYCLIFYKPILPSATLKTKERLQKVMSAATNISEVIAYYTIKSVLLSYYHDTYGVCVPSGCSKRDIEQISIYIGEKVYMDLSVHYCHTEDDVPKLTRGKIVVMCIFVFLGTLTVIGTLTDYYARSNKMELKSLFPRIILCFSITKNFPRVIGTGTSDNALRCLNGIRVLSIFYIILCHRHLAESFYYSQTNFLQYMENLSGIFGQIIFNGFLCVEVFFFLGGFLNCYFRMKGKQNGTENQNFFLLIIHRLWRIYPGYVFAILISILMTARGPLEPLTQYTQNCERNWWHNILFINNFLDASLMCLPQSWYLSCDMQLFLLSLITVPLLLKHSKKGIFLNVAVIFSGLTFSVVWCWIKELPPMFKFFQPDLSKLQSTNIFYCLPFPHIAPYFTGILMGYFLSKKNDIQIPKAYQLLGWPIACLLFTSMLFITKIWHSGADYTRLEASLYFSFSKLLYPLAVAWMTLCCIVGCGGIVNYILALKIWIPLSRISFMMYLLSMTIQMFYNASRRTTQDLQLITAIWLYMGDLAVTGLMSLALVTLVESPFIALEKVLFRRKSTKCEDVTNNHVKADENVAIQENNMMNIQFQTKF